MSRELRVTRRGKAVLERVLGPDTRSLAVFRVGLGSMLLVDLGIKASSLRAFYTDDGFLPGAEPRRRKYEKHLELSADYVQREWNRLQPVQRRVTEVEVYFMLERTLPGYQTAPIERQRIWPRS